ncbi:hypothetical protein KC19_11G035400 [Ceratodon purpureus]|uniref:Uncharacterized protein n=1 Tax=Ceratodon purpureus TaxID=3225 RepID=A0A8T0GGA8_CERPU|nr:hypothetical protein KC19_11G035400 [Ceratodon purpureus]
MTASEFQSLETHSDATVCSGLYAKSTPKWNTKMHASKLLKGVLISRTLNSTSSNQESSSASSPNSTPARGKRAFSSDNALTSTSLIPKKTSSPVKTTCLCAPTKHAGSFRCRLHRVTQKHWDGRQIHPTSTSTAAASSSASLPANENSGTVGVITPWANGVAVPTTGCMSRTGAARPSRLRMVVVAAQPDDSDAPDVDDPASPMLSEGPTLIVTPSWLTGAV